jgi:hypothetical protein
MHLKTTRKQSEAVSPRLEAWRIAEVYVLRKILTLKKMHKILTFPALKFLCTIIPKQRKTVRKNKIIRLFNHGMTSNSYPSVSFHNLETPPSEANDR